MRGECEPRTSRRDGFGARRIALGEPFHRQQQKVESGFVVRDVGDPVTDRLVRAPRPHRLLAQQIAARVRLAVVPAQAGGQPQLEPAALTLAGGKAGRHVSLLEGCGQRRVRHQRLAHRAERFPGVVGGGPGGNERE